MFASTCRRLAALIFGTLLLGPLASAAHAAEDNFIIVQSTTSTQNSGLFDHILPKFTQKTGIGVRVVAVGTGQALKNARNGDGDVVLVHAKRDEEKFVAEGWGVERHDVMYNDFVIVGPVSDPAGVVGIKDAPKAFEKIAAAEAPFVSRGDDSGTHQAELALWRTAGIEPKTASGDWYLESGSGMGATLSIAAGKGGYTLTDRGTWLSFANKGGLRLLVEGDPNLFNQYGVVLVNSQKHPGVKTDLGQAFIDWLISGEGQNAIASFKIDGEQLFFPNARPGA
ncbi:substrate-binding domain-containing protein [Methyloceanibacter sp.]|uniref:substrate-binding domain-containing protein n=1 Tax=Methyloceanibacter sp. TaxID=1965321 RepID=UPI00351B6AEB